MSTDYIQTNDPGAVGAGKSWLHPTTQDYKIRDANNAAWVLWGNLAQSRAGNLPVSGGPVTGPLTGSHNLAPLTTPDFTGGAKTDGKTLARLSDLALMRTDIINSVNSRMQELLSRSTGSVVVNNIAFESVVVSATSGTNFTIALPKYPDGTDAVASEVRAYGASIQAFSFQDMAAGSSYNMQVSCIETGPGTRTYTPTCSHTDWPRVEGVGNFKIVTWILCTR